MIGFVNGILRYKDDGVVVVECGGIGYEVYLTNSAFCNLPDVDEPVKLFTWMLVKEDDYKKNHPKQMSFLTHRSLSFAFTIQQGSTSSFY